MANQVRTMCYEAGGKCICQKHRCAGVTEFNWRCPEHGSSDTMPVSVRVHYHQGESNEPKGAR